METSSKGKSVTTSVPSIAIRFNANAEEIEELYGNHSDEDEQQTKNASDSGAGEQPESSPLKGYLPKLIKRSASIDTSPANTASSGGNCEASSSPPSDPWRFFSDIKGKIEEKLTEIKSRKDEENSPRKLQTVKDEKETASSVSDSEDPSESSLSRTCGAVSTTEGVEMSSDEDTPPSLDKDAAVNNKKDKKSNKVVASPSGLRRRFKLFKHKNAATKEGTISTTGLRDICSVTSGVQRSLATDLNEDVESGVDVLDEQQNQSLPLDDETQNNDDTSVGKEILNELQESIDNIEVDEEEVLNVRELSGCEAKERFHDEESGVTVFSPVGFVDMRDYVERRKPDYSYFIAIALFSVCYYFIQWYSVYLAGMMAGIVITFTLVTIYNKLFAIPLNVEVEHYSHQQQQQIVEIPAVKEHQPLIKYEGWMNEYPDVYDPLSYHISQTQTVFVRLQGNLLRLSHTKSKIGKRAMWNEPKIKANLTYHRIYNLLGAKVTLLPVGLTRKRFWSKKYPICVTLNKDQMNFDYYPVEITKSKSKKDEPMDKKKSNNNTSFMSQRFSKLTEEEDYDFDTESRVSTPSPLDSTPPENHHDSVTTSELDAVLNDALENDEQFDEDLYSLPEDWSLNINDDSPSETKLFLFGRCDREKEDWFRRLVKATHKGANKNGDALQQTISTTLLEDNALENEYMKFMMKYYSEFHKWRKKRDDPNDKEKNQTIAQPLEMNMLWVNAIMARIIFDCVRNDVFTARIKERIQRKLSSIKLPYFIEALNLTELSLGRTAPFLHRATTPVLDDRGMWIDVDMTYEGLVVLILQTNLNLMKLKQQRIEGKQAEEQRPLAMFHSDVDDSAESSSNDESSHFLPNVPGVSFDSTAGGPSNTSKKVLKMVDKIAESKFFQAATDYKYIKNIMEGVSNTDLRLKVEVRSLSGKLVLNIPPPPSDRIFIGFRPVPKLLLSAQPIVGERSISMLRIIHWIEKKLLLEFQKVMVVPNMEDFVIPVMCQKLPG